MIDSKPLASGTFNPVNLKTDGLSVRMGLPMWYHSQWQGRLLSGQATGTEALAEYSRVFSSVEGNTTFYGLPSKARLQQWLRAVPDHFQFCFKVPKAISHVQDPVQAWSGQEGDKLRAFIECILYESPDKLGALILQLPPVFSSRRMELLIRLMDELARVEQVHWAIECRHLSFSIKAKTSQHCSEQWPIGGSIELFSILVD